MANPVFAELLVPLYRSGDPQAAAGLSNRLSKFQNLDVITLTTKISMEAARLWADQGLRTLDAIPGATPIYLFGPSPAICRIQTYDCRKGMDAQE